MTLSMPAPMDDGDLNRLAAQVAAALRRAEAADRQARRLTLRQATARMRLPDWIAKPPNDVSLRRLLDGLPELRLDGYGRVLAAVSGLGDRFLDDIRAGDVRALAQEIRDRVGAERVADAERRRTPLASYRCDDHGHGAQRTFLEVCKRFFAEAVEDQLVPRNPVAKLAKPQRQHVIRALTQAEEHALRCWIRYRRPDPELDVLLVDYLIRTGLRREGVLTQTRDSQSLSQHAVTAFQKGSKAHRVPLAASLMRRALALAEDRGATEPQHALFRTISGAPVTYRHLDGLFAQVQRERIFGHHVPVSTHWMRHTSTERIQTATHDPVLAAFWLNHSLVQFRVTAVYLSEPTWADLCAASEAAFGPLDN